MVFQNHRATQTRLSDIKKNRGILLVAYAGNDPVGFKLGYIIPEQQTFFSWLGGVHPDYRRLGIAQELLNRQEQLVREMKIDTLYFTTFDRFPGMIKLGIKNGYSCTKSALKSDETKYWYEKRLNH